MRLWLISNRYSSAFNTTAITANFSLNSPLNPTFLPTINVIKDVSLSTQIGVEKRNFEY